MDKKAKASARYAIGTSSILGMTSFIIGGFAQEQSTKESFLFVMGFCCIVILFSLTTLLTNTK